MSEKHRKRYSKDFKLQIIRLLKDEQRPITEVSRDTGLHTTIIYRWMKEYSDNPESFLPGENVHPSDKDEIKRLKKKLSDLYEENQIIKKAMAIFSKQQDKNMR